MAKSPIIPPLKPSSTLHSSDTAVPCLSLAPSLLALNGTRVKIDLQADPDHRPLSPGVASSRAVTFMRLYIRPGKAIRLGSLHAQKIASPEACSVWEIDRATSNKDVVEAAFPSARPSQRRGPDAFSISAALHSRLCEPIAFMSIFPYIYFMIGSFGITDNESQIGLYAGLVTSAFAFAEFSTGVLWGRLSDKVGRKPVLMAGLIGTLLSMLVFGFASSLPVALLGRALGGALNGNIGVLQTTVAEIATEKAHQRPLIGGALAEPCINYPSLFARGTLFDRYPFLLPNVVCAVILVLGILVGILFLEETHQEKKYRRDIGLEIGRRLLGFFDRRGRADLSVKCIDANLEESRSLLEDEPPPGYRTTEGSPRYPSSRSLSPAAPPYSRSDARITLARKGPTMGLQKAFTRPVIVHIVGFGILA
ncbi:MAG: hypothetical protein Q9206_000758 [Seirophora lacunosa]